MQAAALKGPVSAWGKEQVAAFFATLPAKVQSYRELGAAFADIGYTGKHIAKISAESWRERLPDVYEREYFLDALHEFDTGEAAAAPTGTPRRALRCAARLRRAAVNVSWPCDVQRVCAARAQ